MNTSRLLSVFLFLITTISSKAQYVKPNGVYIGAELYNTPFNGMQINNIVYYFRDDGKFNDELNKPDWKTNFSGSYVVKGTTVVLTPRNGNETKTYKLSANGNLQSTAGIQHTLHKVKKISAIAAGGYQSKSASNNGGMGTGMPGVFSSSSDFLYFDGKGKFSLDHSSLTAIGDDAGNGTIGGKFENNGQPTGGTYRLEDGEITLTYSNGTVARHSFFYSPPNEEDLIVLDGEFYFREEGEKQADHQEGKTEHQAVAASQRETDDQVGANPLPSAAKVLNQLRMKYGGAAIDQIKTIRERGIMTGNLQMVLLTDLNNHRIRAEISQGGKLLLVRQLIGNDGWQWVNGSIKPLSAEEITEMEINQYQGILGLHKALNSHLSTGKMKSAKGDYVLSFSIKGKEILYLVDKDYRLKGNAYEVNQLPNVSVYKHFAKAGGICYPDITESSDGKESMTVNTTSIEINPIFNAEDWKKP